jgi:hypothetical protein
LRPKIPLGFQFFDGEVTAGVAIALDAPTLALNLTKSTTPYHLLNLTMGQDNSSPQCKPDALNFTTTLSQELSLGLGFEAGVGFDLTKLSPDQRNAQGPALFAAALVNGGSLIQTATSINLFKTTISQSSRCIETGSPAPTITSSSSSSVTPAPTNTPVTTSALPTTTANVNKDKPNAAVSSVVFDVCACMIVVVAMVFLSL